MSKRQEIRAKRRRERIRSQVLTIMFVIAGALLIVFALILPTVQGLITKANATELPVTMIVPRTFNAPLNGTSIGNPNAPVRMDTWEDFQCPSCGSFTQSVMYQVIASYVDTGVVYYTFHIFPFIDDYSEYNESDHAANAAWCADEQGRFWDYHDIVYANWDGENQGAFRDERLIRFAEALQLDMEAFQACFDEKRYQDEIDQDFATGQALGVNATPSIFVNGVKVVSQIGENYVPGFEDIAAAIEAALGGQ